MTTADVGIIGGGLVGCSAALHLRRRGASVILFERRTCGSQASGVNYGGVRQQGRKLVQLPLSRRSRLIWSKLTELIGCDGELLITGHLKLARSDEEMAELEDYAARARPLGLTLELVGRDALRDRYPWLGSDAAGASFCPEDGHANPRIVAPAFARAAHASGAEILENCEVVSAAMDGSEFEVRTGTAIFRVRTLINAAGAWGSKIAEWFSESTPEDVMAPNMAVTEPLPYFIHPNIGICGASIYLRQIPRGNVIFGGGHGVADPDTIRAFPMSDATIRSAQLAGAIVPTLRQAQIIRTWSGIEGIMPDRLPVIGFSQTTPRLLHAFGLSGHGFQLAPGVGAVLSDLVLDGETPTPIDAFSIVRFFAQPAAAVQVPARTAH